MTILYHRLYAIANKKAQVTPTPCNDAPSDASVQMRFSILTLLM
nr:MAG TPA: hypothetical protein [Bacteriophage sp.]